MHAHLASALRHLVERTRLRIVVVVIAFVCASDELILAVGYEHRMSQEILHRLALRFGIEFHLRLIRQVHTAHFYLLFAEAVFLHTV